MLKNFKIIVNDVCVFEDNVDVTFQSEHLMGFSIKQKSEIVRSVNVKFKTNKCDDLDKIIALCILQENKKIILGDEEFYWDDSIDIIEIPEKVYNFFLRREH